MSIVATCQCGKSFQAKPELAGRRVKCPSCGQPFTVPYPPGQVPAVDPLRLGGVDPWAANPATPFQKQPACRQPPMAAQPPGFAGQQRKPAVKKKSNTLLFVLLGVGGIVVAGGVGLVIVVMALLLPAVRQAREAARQQAQRAEQATFRPATTGLAQTDSWVVHAPSGGRFSVELPRTPTARTQSQPSPLGIITINMGIVEDQDGAYFASYNDYPSQMANADPNEVLDSACDHAIRNANAQLEAKQNINIDGHPGRAISFSGTSQGRAIKGQVRMYLVGLRLYQVMWLGNPDKFPQDNVNRVFNSFQLTSTEAPPSDPADLATSETEPAAPPTVTNNATADDAETRLRKQIYRQLAQIDANHELVMKRTETLVQQGGGTNIRNIAEQNRQLSFFALAQNYQRTVEELEAILREGKEKGWQK